MLKTSIVYSGNDFERIAQIWENEDRLLAEMQFHPKFAGRLRWCDLEHEHFSFMVAANMRKISDLKAAEQTDYSHPYYKSLEFVVLALVRCLQLVSICSVETIHINRVSEGNVIISFSATLDNAMVLSPVENNDDNDDDSHDEGLFKIVVDNTGIDE